MDRYIAAHKFSFRNRALLEKDSLCGCFNCKKTFSPDQILDWLDEDETALCPFCYIDSVIGESSGFPITEEFLEGMRRYYFSPHH